MTLKKEFENDLVYSIEYLLDENLEIQPTVTDNDYEEWYTKIGELARIYKQIKMEGG